MQPSPDVNMGDRNQSDRSNALEQVRKKLRNGWRNDPVVLNQYFHSCYNNWKVYKGNRTAKQVLKLQAIYKQATYGDNNEETPAHLESVEGEKWKAWSALKGMPQDMAKRRFITFLSEIDPLLIDVMPDEKPPPGFPLDRRGQQICAKCNTTVGCIRPILDQHKMNLKFQLFENDELHEIDKVKCWIRNALANQRCVWGLHMPITKAEAKPFMDWFNRDENRGFFAYDSMPIMTMVKELVTHYHEIVREMMSHKSDIEAAAYNAQATKAVQLKEIYEQFSGEEYHFEIWCNRDTNESCNQRRIADAGRNHKHDFIIDPPTHSDQSTMEEAIMLRKQCQQLGINPCTGVVRSLAERCAIYRQRIADHFLALQRAAEAKVRNENRAVLHKQEKQNVIALSKSMLQRQCWDACHLNLVDQVLVLVKRGCGANEESSRGSTPLLCMVLNEAIVEKIEALITLKADVNYVNKHGFTPLMMACRAKDMKMIHVLMRNNASALQKGLKGMTCLHICAIHGAEEVARTIVDYLKEGAGNAMRVNRFLDCQDDNGDTAMILAAIRRNGIMCHTLMNLGANPNVRIGKGRTAAFLARSKGWTEIADWLDKKVGGSSSAAKVETFSDLEFERKSRYGLIKVRELLQQFGRLYLTLIQNRLGLSPLGSPHKAKAMIDERGDRARQEQRLFMDSHFRLIHNQYPELYLANNNNNDGDDEDDNKKKTAAQLMEELKTILGEMTGLIRQGWTYPNAEVGPQPLPWTPLMCAVVINDIRSMKLLIREGASPNHGNKEGMTAVMLAAQLQHTEALLDMLTLIKTTKIDQDPALEIVDSYGFTALAYASSLPLPTVMDRDLVDLLTEDDVSGVKLINAAELVKLALTVTDTNSNSNNNNYVAGPSNVRSSTKHNNALNDDSASINSHLSHHSHSSSSQVYNDDTGLTFAMLKELLKINAEQAQPDQVLLAHRRQQLLYQYGLTPLHNEQHLLHMTSTSKWRVNMDKLHHSADSDDEDSINDEFRDKASKRHKKKKKNGKEIEDDDDYLEESAFDHEAKAEFKLQQENAAFKAEEERKMKSGLRCPVCTLAIPCSHFFKIDSLLAFLGTQQAQSAANNNSIGSPSSSSTIRKKVKSKSRAVEILEETRLDDRQSDRSLSFARQFQEKESLLEKDFKLRLSTQTQAEQDDGATKKLTDSSASEDAAKKSSPLSFLQEQQPSSTTDDHKSRELTMDSQHQQDAITTVAVIPTEEATTLVSILKPQMMSSSSVSPSRNDKKRRVRFDLPGNDNHDFSSSSLEEGTNNNGDNGIKAFASTSSDEAHSSKSVIAVVSSSSASLPSSFPTKLNNASDQESSSLVQAKKQVAEEAKGKDQDSNQAADSIEEDHRQYLLRETEAKSKLQRFEVESGMEAIRRGRMTDEYKIHHYHRQQQLFSQEKGLINNKDGNNEPRRIVLFTKEAIGHHYDGGFPVAQLLADEEGEEGESESSHTLAVTIMTTKSAGTIPPMSVKVELSGWLFVHLTEMRDTITVPPFDLTLAPHVYSTIVEGLNELSTVTWTQSGTDYGLLIDWATMRPSAPRCLLCDIGFVREESSLHHYRTNRESYESEKECLSRELFQERDDSQGQSREELSKIEDRVLQFLCCTCLLRRELYRKCLSAQPRKMRQVLPTHWPLVRAPRPLPRSYPLANFTYDNHHNHLQSKHNDNSELDDSKLTPQQLACKAHEQAVNQKYGDLQDGQPWRSSVRSREREEDDNYDNNHKDSNLAQLLQQHEQDQELTLRQEQMNENLSQLSAISQYSDDAHNQHDYDTGNNDNDTMVMSAITTMQPTKRPRELLLLPYLIAAGHVDEAERTIRIALAKEGIDDGRGAAMLLSLLSLQSALYAHLGLYCLSLAILLDATTLAVTLLGLQEDDQYHSSNSNLSIGLAQQTLQRYLTAARRMQREEIADRFVHKCVLSIQQSVRNQRRVLALTVTIEQIDHRSKQQYLRDNSLWTSFIQPAVTLKYRSRHLSLLQMRWVKTMDVSALCVFFSSSTPAFHIHRRLFALYCQQRGSAVLSLYSSFLDIYYRMRVAGDYDALITRHFVQHIMQHFLSKKMVKTSALAYHFRRLTPRKVIMQLLNYLHNGTDMNVIAAFDPLVNHCLHCVLPAYRRYLLHDHSNHSEGGDSLMMIEQVAETMDVAATIIQTTIRRCLVRSKYGWRLPSSTIRRR